jgi:hypothetical protein
VRRDRSIADVHKRETGGSGAGLPCPNCGASIAITLAELMVRRSFSCTTPGCRTVLRLDVEGSQEALAAARSYKAKLDGL